MTVLHRKFRLSRQAIRETPSRRPTITMVKPAPQATVSASERHTTRRGYMGSGGERWFTGATEWPFGCGSDGKSAD